jgi:hypothetical protein
VREREREREREGQKLTIDFVFHGYIGMKDTERADKFSKFNNTVLLNIKQIKNLQKQKGSPMSQTKKSHQMTREPFKEHHKGGTAIHPAFKRYCWWHTIDPDFLQMVIMFVTSTKGYSNPSLYQHILK